jgi:hypothetical protein
MNGKGSAPRNCYSAAWARNFERVKWQAGAAQTGAQATSGARADIQTPSRVARSTRGNRGAGRGPKPTPAAP